MTAQEESLLKRKNSAVIPFGVWRDVCLQQRDHVKKEDFRSEANRLFSSIVQSTEMEVGGSVVKTKSSHNETMAQLIQELSPALTTEATHLSRIWAMYCICGAVEGCATAGLSHAVTKLLGNFLLEHCGPLEEDDVEDSDEIVRDTAILCLSALVRTPLDSENLSDPKENIALRIDLAQKGVQKRCALPEEDGGMDYDSGYDFPRQPNTNDIRGGLSALPRSRRSLCFGLIRSCVDGIASFPRDAITFDATAHLSSFATFAATCLHGESDPRCLQQLLLMMNALQISFTPYFTSDTGTAKKFPVMNVFDAVAPYYPIQFTPPPNDIHGITKRGLHLALMSVLSFIAFDNINGCQDTMLNLAAGIFLERMVPMEDEDSTMQDKQESIEDLSALLFAETGSCGVRSCTQLQEDILRELSVAMMSIHAEAAANVASGGEKGRQNKILADTCRSLVSKVAAELEIAKDESLWNIFVSDVVRENAFILSTSPQTLQGRTTVAYLACLAASGGLKSLNTCLQHALPRLVDALNLGSDDEEKIVAAAYGVAAFYSSFRVCFDRGSKAGVDFYPHPLKDFTTLKALLPLATESKVSSSPCVAAIRAMDAVLLVTPPDLISDEDYIVIHSFIDSLTNAVTAFDEKDLESELLLAASRTLSSFISRCVEWLSENDKTMPSALDREDTRQFVKDVIFIKIISHSTCFATKKYTETRRYDLLTLAQACEQSKAVAEIVVRAHSNALGESLKVSGPSDRSKAIAASLSFVLQRGGCMAIAAFHQATSPDTSSLNILQLLILESTRDSTNLTSHPRPLGNGMSALELPPTDEEREAMAKSVSVVYEIIPYLLPAFDTDLPSQRLLDFADIVEHLLPPLSDFQNAQLCIALPFFSSGLRHRFNSSPGLAVKLKALFPHLLDFAFSSDNNNVARAAAASCMHSTVTLHQSSADDDISNESLKSTISPLLVLSVQDAATSMQVSSVDDDTCAEKFGEFLSITAMLGGGAACRGMASTKTGDAILEMLVRLACTGQASLPFSGETLDLNTIEDVSLRTKCQRKAASAFGVMVSLEGDGQFWKQRLTHKATTLLGELGASSSFVNDKFSPNSQGRLVLLCHIIVSSPIKSFKQDVLASYAEELISAFVMTFPKQSDDGFVTLENSSSARNLQELHLTAALKMMACSPQVVAKYIPLLVSTFARVLSTYYSMNEYGTGDGDDDADELPILFLALQGMLNATTSFEEEFRKHLVAMKAAVASILSSYLDHPCVSFRQAVVVTCNKWAVLA